MSHTTIPELNLYDASNIDQASWPQTCEGQEAKAYLTPLIKEGTASYFGNIRGKVFLLDVGGSFFPILMASNNYEDSYVSSIFGQYITLASESLFVIKNDAVRKLAAWVLKNLGDSIRRGNINNAIYVNHGLFSTDLHDDALSNSQLQAITHFLQRKFPHHAIIFRAINAKCYPKLRENLKSCGYRMIASRQVHLSKTASAHIRQVRALKSDLKLWKESTFEVSDLSTLTPEDEERILFLYQKVALDHSPLNPHVTPHFLRLAASSGAMKFKTLRKEGMIEGVVGYVNRNKLLTCSIFGYNKDHKESSHLYRLLSTLLLLEASKCAEIFHQSSGASFFKKIRKAESYIEFHGVYASHLSLRHRISWKVLRMIMNSIAVPLMKRY